MCRNKCQLNTKHPQKWLSNNQNAIPQKQLKKYERNLK